MTRGRIHVASAVPETGASKVNTDVIVTWDDGARPNDVEESIKEAARKAIVRFREVRVAVPA